MSEVSFENDDGMMEVSFENLNVRNHSAMSVDEGNNSYLPDSDNNNIQQSSLHDCTDESVSSKQLIDSVNLSDQENSSSRCVAEFPTKTENTTESVDILRFPFCNTNDQNLYDSTDSGMDRRKLHILDSPKKHVHTSGKENQCVDASNEMSEFPLLTNRRPNDKFPCEPFNIPSKSIDVGNCPLEEAEKFTSANQYHFSAIDFDCLLSRGSSHAEAANCASDASISLPRNSVLINFDPLFRRQSNVTADSLLPNDFEPSVDRSVNLLEFPTKQENCSSQSKSGYVTPSESDLFLKSNKQAKQQCVAIDESGGLAATKRTISEGFPVQDSTVKQRPLQLLDKSLFGSATCSYQPPNVACASGSEEQRNKKPPFIDSSRNFTFSTLVEPVNEHSLLATTGTLNQNILAESQNNREEDLLTKVDLNPNNDTHVAELLKFRELTVPEAVPCDLVKQIFFPNLTADPKEADELMQMNNMLDISIPEKQRSFLNNMSDDQTAHVQDASHEVEKKCKTDECNFADMEKKMHAVDLREESMLKRITEKDKTICKMSNVVEAYERTIAELISEKETLIRTHELDCESLKQDNEINAQHLESLEKTFSNLYAKYERMKKNAVEYKEREEKLLNKVLKLEECLRAQEQRYEKMKSHAMSQLEIANTKIDEANRNHSQESAKLKAQIKKEELYRISINEQLIQKSKENEELVKICDELISDTN